MGKGQRVRNIRNAAVTRDGGKLVLREKNGKEIELTPDSQTKNPKIFRDKHGKRYKIEE